MSYIGQNPFDGPYPAGDLVVDKFSGNNSNTAFTLSKAPLSENNTFVFISGVYQDKDQYSISGTTITFTAAPPTGTNNIQVIQGQPAVVTTPGSGTVITSSIEDGAVTGVKMTPYSGAVVQSVIAEYTANADLTGTIPGDDTIPQNTEGVEFLTATITPKSASNKLRVKFQGVVSIGATDGAAAVALFRDSTANAISAAIVWISIGTGASQIVIEKEVTANSTSSTTFKLRAGNSAGVTVRFNGQTSGRLFGGVMATTLVIEEIQA